MTEKQIGLPDEVVLSKIYMIRDQKVMLDKDLSELYDVEVKRLNEQVNRNIDRFPDDFMFQLNESEWSVLKSQFATSSWGGTRKLPFAFTEHGVLMLSSVLNSKQAIQVNIHIMRIFTKVRQMLFDNTDLRLEIEKIKQKLNNQGKNMEIVFQYLDELQQKTDKLDRKIDSGKKNMGFQIGNK
ncbi:ORF6N domain-containing protein [Pedobacter heparinus]|uniref:ORF6N domain-containing protein n=1 Tax=Pedobacter heparinus TaxID=984 RepID=UPI0029301CB6|nr:ORF6N domain-containing protein [Pedobacter heparinus]